MTEDSVQVLPVKVEESITNEQQDSDQAIQDQTAAVKQKLDVEEEEKKDVKHIPDQDQNDNERKTIEDNNNTSTQSDDDSEKTNLIVNYLPQEMEDEEFENLFKKFGAMKSCKIVRNRQTGFSYGFGFVDFETHEQAMQAIAELNGFELESKRIKVAFARPAGQDIKQANLYIKGIPNEWTQDDVRKAFESYGNIIQVRVLGNNRGIAFVLYDLRKQAEDALEAMNGKTVEGGECPLEIKFAADKKEKTVGKTNNNNNNSNGQQGQRRERGNRGGRNRSSSRNDRDNSRGRQQSGQRSFFDQQRDNKQRDRSRSRGGQYRQGNSYNPNNDNDNGQVGPMRQNPVRMNRYAPFATMNPQQQQPNMMTMPQLQMTPQILPQQQAAMAAAYGYPQQQQPMIPYPMLQQSQQPGVPMTMAQTGQMAMNPVVASQMQAQANLMQMYAGQMPMTHTPIAQNAMSNMYSVASNNLTNAANLQPQTMSSMRHNTTTNNGGMMSNTSSNDSSGGTGGRSRYDQNDGVTLFVYNIGPDSNEEELRTTFGPYGQVVKCNVVRKTPGGETKGFGFVTLKDRGQAEAAISGLNGSMKNGRTLQVSFKK